MPASLFWCISAWLSSVRTFRNCTGEKELTTVERSDASRSGCHSGGRRYKQRRLCSKTERKIFDGTWYKLISPCSSKDFPACTPQFGSVGGFGHNPACSAAMTLALHFHALSKPSRGLCIMPAALFEIKSHRCPLPWMVRRMNPATRCLFKGIHIFTPDNHIH